MMVYDFVTETRLKIRWVLNSYAFQEAVFVKGGSLIKVLYKRLQGATDGEAERLVMYSMPISEWKQVVPVIKKLVDQSFLDSAKGTTIYATGVGTLRFKDDVEEAFDVKLTILSEFKCFGEGVKYLTDHSTNVANLFYVIEDEDLKTALDKAQRLMKMRTKFGRVEGPDPHRQFPEIDLESDDFRKQAESLGVQLKFAGKITEPYLLVTIGSGAAFNKVTPEGTVHFVELDQRAGRTFLGLGALLTGKQSFSDLIALAESGSADQVDGLMHHETAVSDDDPSASASRPGSNMYTLVPPDLYLYSFGQARDKSLDDFRPADLAAALLRHLLGDFVQLAVHASAGVGVRHVIYTGSFVSHPHVQRQLARLAVERSMQQPPELRVHHFICKNAGHIGALGAWIQGLQP